MENKISKQSIRTGVSIFSAGEKLDKDTVISKSEKWSDKEITFFRKMINLFISSIFIICFRYIFEIPI